MTSVDDGEALLDALYAQHLRTDKRPSLHETKLRFLPEWDNDRLFDAAQALEDGGDILNPSGGVVYVDLSSKARARASSRASSAASQPSSTTINIGSAHNSPIQNVGAGGSGVQNTSYQPTKSDLNEVVRIYRQHVDELALDDANRRRANAQVATIEAQLLDEPDPTIVQAAGKSLKTIIEGAIAGAASNAILNPHVWANLLSLLG